MRINSNIPALAAWRQLARTDEASSRSLERLSSGQRINRAADDAAGLAVSEKLRAQIRGCSQGVRNLQDGISLLQTAEGGLQEITNMISRLRELAVQAASDTLNDHDRAHLQTEVNQLVDEVDRIAQTTEFNGRKLLAGGDGEGSITIRICFSGRSRSLCIKIEIKWSTGSALGLRDGDENPLDVATRQAASDAVTTLDQAMAQVSGERTTLGSWQNRLEHTINNLRVQAENLTAAESRIRDVDMAREMTSFARNQVLLQSGVAMLAQANMNPQAVLQLLR